MRFSKDWKDYELIDISDGQKLERWSDTVLIRPESQVIWSEKKEDFRWHNADASFRHTDKGEGEWEMKNKIKDSWTVNYNDLVFKVMPAGFKHTGLFPEQAVNWDFLRQNIRERADEVNALNLFAYTGGASVAMAKDGAKVCHVDASKAMNAWARENANLSGVKGDRIRYLTDDCEKFVRREIRRNNKYEIIVMDPPAYGRGPTGEFWKLEEKIAEFVSLCTQLLSENAICMVVNSYTSGVSTTIMEYIIRKTVVPRMGGKVFSDEIGLKVSERDFVLPCGQTTIWTRI